MSNRRPNRRRATWLTAVLITAGASTLMGTLLFSWWTGDRMVREYAPLIRASMQVKVEATLAHLWFEEWVSGDRSLELERVWEHLDRAEWSARAMLDGAGGGSLVPLPVREATVRAEIEQVREGLREFRQVAEQRAAARLEAAIGSDVDQRFDAIFDRFLQQAGTAEAMLRSAMWERLAVFRVLQFALVLATLAVAIGIGLTLMRFIRQRDRAHEERHKIEASLQRSQKLESLGVMAGGIAHDFNNILQAVIGNISLALDDEPIPSATRAILEEVEIAADRGAELCRQMLAYSGKGQFVVQALDLSAVVADISSLLLAGISEPTRVEFNLTEGLPAVEADATQMRQVTMNLVSNAAEATGEEGGTICVTTGAMHWDGRSTPGMSSDRPLPSGQYVFLEVRDSGHGMDGSTLEKIFDPFFTTKFSGRGLGLAAVQGIVRGHRGALQIDSQPGEGTTFKLLLPALESAVDSVRQPEANHDAWRGSGTLLLVDDEEPVLRVTQRMLEELGFTVLVASSGRQAVELFRANQVDVCCAVLDLTMPDLGGVETFEQLRALRPDLPVVMSSGYNHEEVRRRFTGESPAGFLHKPYRIAELSSAIRQACEAEISRLSD